MPSPSLGRAPVKDVVAAIGNTPLIRLSSFEAGLRNVELYAKAEWKNPGGSVKDRAAARMIAEGERSGALTRALRGHEHLIPRSMLVRKLVPLPVEAVVRGYLAGSGFKEYTRTGARAANVVRHYGFEDATTLAGYRNRYALHRTDPDLQSLHAAAPCLVTWDDHEVDNNYAGLISENEWESEEQMHNRRAAAYQAWWEHTAARVPRAPSSAIRSGTVAAGVTMMASSSTGGASTGVISAPISSLSPTHPMMTNAPSTSAG